MVSKLALVAFAGIAHGAVITPMNEISTQSYTYTIWNSSDIIHEARSTSAPVGEEREISGDAFDSALGEAGAGSTTFYTYSDTTIEGFASTTSNASSFGPGVFAQAVGQAELVMIFELSEASPFELEISVAAGPSFLSSAEVELSGFRLEATGGDDENMVFSGNLDAGVHTLSTFAEALAFGSDGGQSVSEAQYSFSLRLVPSPASLALLGFGALAVSRRR